MAHLLARVVLVVLAAGGVLAAFDLGVWAITLAGADVTTAEELARRRA